MLAISMTSKIHQQHFLIKHIIGMKLNVSSNKKKRSKKSI